jgi:tetratricopeptide (TPR) repeat protein
MVPNDEGARSRYDQIKKIEQRWNSLTPLTFTEDQSHEGSKAVETWMGRARLLNSLGNFSEAADLYHRVSRLMPTYIPAKIKHANSLRQLGKYGEAEDLFFQILRQSANRKLHAQAYAGLGALYRQKETLDQSRSMYTKAIQYKSDYANAHYGLGKIMTILEEYPEGISHLVEALRYQPSEGHWLYNNLAIASLLQGSKAEARSNFERALELAAERQERAERLYFVQISQLVAWAGFGEESLSILERLEETARNCAAIGILSDARESFDLLHRAGIRGAQEASWMLRSIIKEKANVSK